MSNFPKPSEIMRERRPNLYSDSSKVGAYTLSRSEFSYFLDTLTDRNQHKEFEVFCRHLCERTLCPNLRTQTGPEGGGDGKVDTETYAVSDEVTQRWYVGAANAGNERWGFAMSIQKDWAPKFRNDVKGIVGTGRKYDRIYFLTSRPVKANKCHDAEKKLTDEYDVPVTILDREWIIEKTIHNGYEDLAYGDLGAGRHDPDKLVVGPNDHQRSQELNKVEGRIARLGNEPSDQTQLVSDTFEAAKLSRELERPRFETEGRFRRANHTATKSGTHDQILRAKYEFAWTMLWWFDDIEPLNQSYEDIEDIASRFDNAADLSKLGNLLQVLAARVLQGWETAEHLSLDARRERLGSKLSDLSQDKSRPNNALYAETLLVLNRMTDTNAIGNEQVHEEVWRALANIIDRADGLSEFPAELIDQVVEVMSGLVSESDALDDLAENLAEFMGQRQKEGKAGEIYLLRGKGKLKNELPIEAVIWLGKASIYFMKDEYKEELFETLYHLTVAYRGAGLLWAARAVCLSALVQANAISSEDAEIKIETIPTVSLLALLSLQLGRVSDLLLCVVWMQGMYFMLPIDEESKSRVEGKISELDILFSCFLAGVDRNSLSEFLGLPDVLESLCLFQSTQILLYRLGRANELEQHGLMPRGTDIGEIADLVNAAASQPASSSFPGSPRLSQGHDFVAETSIIGVRIEFFGGSSIEDILLCEGCVSAIESFLATALSNNIWPKAEKLKVLIEIKDGIDEPEFFFKPEVMTLSLGWPKSLSVLDAIAVSDFGQYLVEFCSLVAAAIAVMPEAESSLEHMITQEKLFERTVSFSFAHFAQCRILGKYMSSLDDLSHLATKSYPPVDPLPEVVPRDPDKKDPISAEEPEGCNQSSNTYSALKRHDDLAVSSVINTHLWDNAGWHGVLYGRSMPTVPQPPFLGLVFDNREMASAIFGEWNEKFGWKDVDDRIRIAIIRGINLDNPHHYRVHITQSIESVKESINDPKRIFCISRLNTMEPNSSMNLETFLKQFELFRAFTLIPCISSENTREPELLRDHSILCRNLHVRQASEIGENDQDIVAVRERDKVATPSTPR